MSFYSGFKKEGGKCVQVQVISLQAVLLHHNSIIGMGLSNGSFTQTQDSNSVDPGTALFAQICLPQNLGFSQ